MKTNTKRETSASGLTGKQSVSSGENNYITSLMSLLQTRLPSINY